MLSEMRRSADAAKGAADTALSTLQDSRVIQRPWVGIVGDVQLAGPITLSTLPSIPDKIGIDLLIMFRIKNVGSAPAFRTFDAAMMAAGKERPNEILMQGECSSAERQSAQLAGEALPPQGEITLRKGETGGFKGMSVGDMQTLWVLGCIAYQDYSQKTYHHYKWWIEVTTDPKGASPSSESRGEPFKYFNLPVTGMWLAGSGAD